MTTRKTLLQLWNENGCKPFEAIDKSVGLNFHVETVVKTPDSLTNAFGWAQGSKSWTVLPAEKPEWALFEVEEFELVAHYQAVLLVKWPEESYTLSSDLHSNEKEAKNFYGNRFVKLATEAKPIMLPLPKRS